jgi:hypothetical protein
MKLVIAVASLALASLVFSVALIGGRDPRQPRWASDGMVANVYVPIIIGLGLVGFSCLFSALWNLGTQRPALWEIGSGAVVVLGALYAIKALHVGSRLARFAQEEAETQGAQVIRFEPPETLHPETPPNDAGRAAA